MIGAAVHREEVQVAPVITYGPTHNETTYDKDTMVCTIKVDIWIMGWEARTELIGIAYPGHDPDPYAYHGELVLLPDDPSPLCP